MFVNIVIHYFYSTISSKLDDPDHRKNSPTTHPRIDVWIIVCVNSVDRIAETHNFQAVESNQLCYVFLVLISCCGCVCVCMCVLFSFHLPIRLINPIPALLGLSKAIVHRVDAYKNMFALAVSSSSCPGRIAVSRKNRLTLSRR